MIIFYPRDIGMWHNEFDFNPDVTLTPKEKTNYKTFCSKEELINFLKDHGVKLTDPNYPLIFHLHNNTGLHTTLGSGVSDVVQWSLLGWVKCGV